MDPVNNAYQLTVLANHSPTVLEKMLQVVRYRGFNIANLQVQTLVPVEQSRAQLLINLSVHSTNTIELLTKQLDKVFDIVTVEQGESTSNLMPVQQVG